MIYPIGYIELTFDTDLAEGSIWLVRANVLIITAPAPGAPVRIRLDGSFMGSPPQDRLMSVHGAMDVRIVDNKLIWPDQIFDVRDILPSRITKFFTQAPIKNQPQIAVLIEILLAHVNGPSGIVAVHPRGAAYIVGSQNQMVMTPAPAPPSSTVVRAIMQTHEDKSKICGFTPKQLEVMNSLNS